MNWTSQADTLIDDVDVAHCARPDWTLNKNGPKPGGRHHSPVSAQAGWSGKSFEPRRGSRVPPAAAQGRGARRPDQRPLHRPGWRRPRLLPVPRRPARATACLLPARRRLPGDAARRRHDLVAKEFVTAQAAGEGAAALVLRSAYPRTMWAPDYPWGRTEEEYRREMERDLGIFGPRDQALDALRSRMQLVDDDEAHQWVDYLRWSGSPGALEALALMNKEIDVRQVLPAIRVPTLVLHGTEDTIVPIEVARYVADRISGARLVEVPTGHLAT